MKPGSKDKKAILTFTEAELDLLQDNTDEMAESFGLDRRISNLTGKRPVGFYSWDLDCLEAVVSGLQTDANVDKTVVDALYDKIVEAMNSIS
jgi:hypothetical protein